MNESKKEVFFVLLQQAQEKKTLVSVYDDSDDVTHFEVGIPLWLSATEIIIETFDVDGSFDGFRWSLLENVLRVDVNGCYEKKIELLRKQNTNWQPSTLESLCYKEDISLLVRMLRYASANNLAVEIEQEGSGTVDLQGLVKKTQSSPSIIRVLSDYGEDDGTSCFDIASVTGLRVNSKRGQALVYLNTCSNTGDI